MQLTISSADGINVFSINISETATIENLKSTIAVGLGIPADRQKLFVDMKPIAEHAGSMKDAGIADGCLILVTSLVGSSGTTANHVAHGGSQSTQQTPARPTSTDASNYQSPLPGNESMQQIQNVLDFSDIVVEGGRATHRRPPVPLGAPAVGSRSTPLQQSEEQEKPEDEDTRLVRQQAQALVATCCANDGTLAVIALQNPELGTALRLAVADSRAGNDERGGMQKVVSVMMASMLQRKKETEEKNRRMVAALQDPLSAAAQEFMLQQIQDKQVEENFMLAQEHLPETFAQIYMLFVDIEVNGVPIKAFVDSGAQSTFMSLACAEKCNLLRLLDRRFKGTAQGVGKAEIVGKIHMASIKIGTQFFPSSFLVLDDDKVEFLFGLDLLRRYQCLIDLKKNVLKIDNEEVPFLSEKDITKGMFGRGDRTSTSEFDQTEASIVSSNSRAAHRVEELQSNMDDEDKKIKQLTDLGFLRTDAQEALRISDGSIEHAAAHLFKRQQEAERG